MLEATTLVDLEIGQHHIRKSAMHKRSCSMLMTFICN